DYTYPVPGKYTAQAVLHFTVNGKDVTSKFACPAGVSPTQPPTPECKPGVVVGSPLCTPCQYDVSIQSDSPQCVAPPTALPNTGAGNTVALAGVLAVAGFMIYRQVIFRRHKRAFASADNGTSPRLDPDAPFADAPEPVRSTFRRRRPF
ncbi:MAG: hypothetical protein ABI220_01270, partial [Candidatus Saccharimonadales bacterium]